MSDVRVQGDLRTGGKPTHGAVDKKTHACSHLAESSPGDRFSRTVSRALSAAVIHLHDSVRQERRLCGVLVGEDL